ncbi:hypothetical protein ACN28S_58540 [Cystobacter fuscus]
MRARPASRLTLVPRPEAPADSPEAARSDSSRQHAPPHRATRRPSVPGEGLGALLRQGPVSAGIGALKNSGEALRCFGLGLGALARGHLLLGGARLRQGLASLVRLALDAPLSVGGRLVSGVQTKLGLETPGCPLGARQLMELRKVFGGSIDYGRVCIKTGRLGLLALPRRPFVLGYTLYLPSGSPSRPRAGCSGPSTCWYASSPASGSTSMEEPTTPARRWARAGSPRRPTGAGSPRGPELAGAGPRAAAALPAGCLHPLLVLPGARPSLHRRRLGPGLHRAARGRAPPHPRGPGRSLSVYFWARARPGLPTLVEDRTPVRAGRTRRGASSCSPSSMRCSMSSRMRRASKSAASICSRTCTECSSRARTGAGVSTGSRRRAMRPAGA